MTIFRHLRITNAEKGTSFHLSKTVSWETQHSLRSQHVLYSICYIILPYKYVYTWITYIIINLLFNLYIPHPYSIISSCYPVFLYIHLCTYIIQTNTIGWNPPPPDRLYDLSNFSNRSTSCTSQKRCTYI